MKAIAIAIGESAIKNHDEVLASLQSLHMVVPKNNEIIKATERLMIDSLVDIYTTMLKSYVANGDVKKLELALRFHIYQLEALQCDSNDLIGKAHREVLFQLNQLLSIIEA